jgi:hypothetical protein
VFAAFVSREMDAPATLTAILSRYRQAKCPLSCRVNQLLEQRNATQRSEAFDCCVMVAWARYPKEGGSCMSARDEPRVAVVSKGLLECSMLLLESRLVLFTRLVEIELCPSRR